MAMTLSQFVQGLYNLRVRWMPVVANETLEEMSDIVIRTAKPLTRVDTGLLKKSYVKAPRKQEGNNYSQVVYNRATRGGNQSYAAFNELGTSKMAPRLMLTTGGARAFQRAQGIATKNFKKAFNIS